MVKCPKCNAELKKTGKYCPNCGSEIESLYDKIQHHKNNKNKLVIVPIVVIFILGSLLIYGNFFALSKDAKAAITNIQNLKSIMKDIESFVLNDDVLVLHYDSDIFDDYCGCYMYIDYSARNSYGGMVRKTAVFYDNVYIGNIEDDVDINNSMIITLIHSRLVQTFYEIESSEIISSEIVKKSDIIKKLK